MRTTTFDTAQLAAFADGQLSPEEAAAVVIHLADHPKDQAYVDDLMAANEALVRAFAAPMTEPVPSAIRAVINGQPTAAKVVPFPRRAAWAVAALALAASLSLAVVMVQRQQSEGLTIGPVAQGEGLHELLQTLPSGQTVPLNADRDLTIMATLPTKAGHCREVEVIDRENRRLDLALACTTGEGWNIEVALSEPLPAADDGQTYVPAGGDEAAALTPWLDRLEAGLVMDAASEAEVMARGWSR